LVSEIRIFNYHPAHFVKILIGADERVLESLLHDDSCIIFSIDATAETNRLGRLVNHSRNGNLVTRIVEVGSTPHLVLTAKEDIPINVEVSYDYGDRSRESIRHHPWLAL